jgi:hypothetical protein
MWTKDFVWFHHFNGGPAQYNIIPFRHGIRSSMKEISLNNIEITLLESEDPLNRILITSIIFNKLGLDYSQINI